MDGLPMKLIVTERRRFMPPLKLANKLGAHAPKVKCSQAGFRCLCQLIALYSPGR